MRTLPGMFCCLSNTQKNQSLFISGKCFWSHDGSPGTTTVFDVCFPAVVYLVRTQDRNGFWARLYMCACIAGLRSFFFLLCSTTPTWIWCVLHTLLCVAVEFRRLFLIFGGAEGSFYAANFDYAIYSRRYDRCLFICVVCVVFYFPVTVVFGRKKKR